MSVSLSPKAQAPTLAVLFAVVFINLVGFGLVVPLLPFFAQSLQAEPWQITLMFSAYSLGQFFAEPFWGRLSDRIGRKPVLLATLAANAVGYLLLAFAPNIWVAVAVRLFTGLGAGNISTVQGYIADVTPPERRAGRMGLIGAAFGLGFIVGPGLGGLLAQPQMGHVGYQLPIFAASGAAVAAALGVMFFLRESRTRADPAAPRPAFLSGVSFARTDEVISRVLMVSLIYLAGFSAMEAAFGLWAEHRYAWTAREVGLSFMIVGLISAVNQGLVAGRLARRFGEARVLAVGILLFGLSMVLQVAAPVAWFPAGRIDLGLFSFPLVAGWIIPVIMGIGACGMSLAMPNISAMISRSSPPDRQGAMLGLNMAAGSMARIVGPIVAGVLYSAVGPNWPFLAGAALTVPAAAMAINAGRAVRHRSVQA
ncbi:MFS transporter [Brevundimonas naejangsanensis]